MWYLKLVFELFTFSMTKSNRDLMLQRNTKDNFLLCLHRREYMLVALSCPTLCNPMDCSTPGSSVREIFQARVLEWVAISFFRGSSQPRDQTWVSYIAGRFFTIWAFQKVPCVCLLLLLLLLSHFSHVGPCATHRRQPTRLPHPWDSPGKNTGVGCHLLLQCIKVKSESEVAQSCPTLSNPMDCSPPGSSVHGIFQARALEWGATAFSLCLPNYNYIWYVTKEKTFSFCLEQLWCGLNILVLSKFICRNPSPQSHGIRMQIFERWLSDEDGALMNRISAIIKESFLTPSAMWGHRRKWLSMNQEVSSSQALNLLALCTWTS